tara:strand:- start:2876 stop:3430 length:555 start_codon:yes stop_codon:yes gene_type:complete
MSFDRFLSYHRIYSVEEVKKINKSLALVLEKPGTSTTKGPKGAVKDCTVSVAPWGKTKSFLKPFIERAFRINEEVFGAHLYPMRDDYYFIHNAYQPGQQYGYHVDESAHPPSSCKLTCLLNLSTQSYTGGEFLIQPGGESMLIEEFNIPGVMVVFPSFILHKVRPLKKGTRISLAALLEGPKWV